MRAAFGIGPEDAGEKSLDGFGFGGFRGRRFECIPAGGQVFGTMAIGEDAVMPDALKALGEHMEEKPTDKFLDREAHHLHFVAMSVVAPTEADLAVLASEYALVQQLIRQNPKLVC